MSGFYFISWVNLKVVQKISTEFDSLLQSLINHSHTITEWKYGQSSVMWTLRKQTCSETHL